MAKIRINDKDYPFRVAINTFRLLGRATGMELADIMQRLDKVQKTSSDGSLMTFDDMEFFAQFIRCGIADASRREGASVYLEIDDIIDCFDSPGIIENAFSEIAGSMPASDAEKEGNLQPEPKAPVKD